LPVNYRLIEKTETYTDKKTGKEKRRSPIRKNEIYRQLLQEVSRNQIPFGYIINDVWFAAADHKSLKQNASLSKSPTKTVTTQSNHFFASLCSYIKLEMLKVKTKTNHFALKSKGSTNGF
jgi:hypothetical protein